MLCDVCIANMEKTCKRLVNLIPSGIFENVNISWEEDGRKSNSISQQFTNAFRNKINYAPIGTSSFWV